MKLRPAGKTGFRIYNKETKKDVTNVLNPCLHHSGRIVTMSPDGKIREMDVDKLLIKIVKGD